MTNWVEIRTAYQVGRLGTVTAAANSLGVHRATVIRHIDTLESELGTKLFQRHNRGYTPTELGMELIKVAERVDTDFSSLIKLSQAKDKDLSGELVIACRELATTLIIPQVSKFQRIHPTIHLNFNVVLQNELIDHKFPRLEIGEAHISIRVGKHDEHPDYVHKFYQNMGFGLYASAGYAAKYGIPKTHNDIGDHRFVCYIPPEPMFPVQTWVRDNIPERNIVFTSPSPLALDRAMLCGLGIGFYPLHLAKMRDDLIEVWKPWPEWFLPIWCVTHVDLRTGSKVRAFLDFLDDKTNH